MGRVATGIALAAMIGLCSALYIKVEPREERCFNYDFSGNSEVKVSLSVHRGGLLDIRYKVCACNAPSSPFSHTHTHLPPLFFF